MEQACAVRGFDALHRGEQQRDGFLRGQRATLDVLAERSPVEELHHQEHRALVFADVEHRDHVRVLDRAERPRFELHALRELRARRDQTLERDATTREPMSRAVDGAHSARRESSVDDVLVADDRAGSELGRSGGRSGHARPEHGIRRGVAGYAFAPEGRRM